MISFEIKRTPFLNLLSFFYILRLAKVGLGMFKATVALVLHPEDPVDVRYYPF